MFGKNFMKKNERSFQKKLYSKVKEIIYLKKYLNKLLKTKNKIKLILIKWMN